MSVCVVGGGGEEPREFPGGCMVMDLPWVSKQAEEKIRRKGK